MDRNYLKNVSVGDLDYDDINVLPDADYLLTHYTDEINDWIAYTYGREGGLDIIDFLVMIEYRSQNLIANFPEMWKDLYRNGLLDAEKLVKADRFLSNEERLVELADHVSADFGRKVRQALIREGRWSEADVRESFRPYKDSRPVFESRKNRIPRRKYRPHR